MDEVERDRSERWKKSKPFNICFLEEVAESDVPNRYLGTYLPYCIGSRIFPRLVCYCSTVGALSRLFTWLHVVSVWTLALILSRLVNPHSISLSHSYCQAIAKEAVGAIQNRSSTFGVNGLETAETVSCKYTQHALRGYDQ